jgi:hypothetical protein
MAISDYNGYNYRYGYYQNNEKENINRARQFITSYLEGVIVDEIEKIDKVMQPYDMWGQNPFKMDEISNHYKIEARYVKAARIDITYDSINKIQDLLQEISLNCANAEHSLMNVKNKSNKLKELLDNNSACKAAWEKFIMLAQLSDAPEDLVKFLQERKFG